MRSVRLVPFAASFFVTSASRFALVVCLALVPLLGCTPAEEAGETIVVGLVPAREAQVLLDNAEPLEALLSAELGVPVKTFVPQDYTGLVEAMGSGQADIGMLPPLAAMLGRDRYGIEPILVSIRDGLPTYYTQWMTNDFSVCESEPTTGENGLSFCDGPIEVVRGKRVAFTDATSTSGHLFPAMQLRTSGIDPDDDIQKVFVGGHDASVIALYSGDVDFGVSFDDAREALVAEYPDVAEKVVVFNRADPIPNDGVTVRGDLSAEMKDKIQQAFLTITEREMSLPQAERTLWKIYEIDGFVVPDDGVYDAVWRAYKEMGDHAGE
ncbi:MAG: phosphate/phosphite/phosphonate ABC transporter substrate-binding protein [Acidobacteriota bacterium]